MAQTFTVPSHTYSAGPTPFGPFTIAAGNTRIKLSCSHVGAWPGDPDTLLLSAKFEVSFDAGVNWQFLGSVGWGGGTLGLDKNGVQQTANVFTTGITSPCQVRGVADFVQPVTTTITVDLT